MFFHTTVRNSEEEINEHIHPTCFAFLTHAHSTCEEDLLLLEFQKRLSLCSLYEACRVGVHLWLLPLVYQEI